MSKDLFIRRVYEYKGINVAVDIDLVKKQISLVEKLGNDDFRHKNWYFAERELKYMKGWLKVLDAMKYAITEASKELEAEEERNEKEFIKMLVKINDNLDMKK